MSLDGYSKVFFGPIKQPDSLEVKPTLGFLQPGKLNPPAHDPKAGKSKKTWQPKPPAKPWFLEATPSVDKKTAAAAGTYAAAKQKYNSALSSAKSAGAEYESASNSLKAAQQMSSPKVKLYAAQVTIAKKKYDQKLHEVEVAKQQMNTAAAKVAKPNGPNPKVHGPAGEELTGPSSLTLAKNHAMLSTGKSFVA